MSSVIQISGLHKKYGSIHAVNSLTMQVEMGSIFGLLGPNGSGKSTTLGMILGIINPDAGTFSWFGSNNGNLSRRRIGALLEQPNFYPYLSAARNLHIVCDIKQCDHKRVDVVLARLNLLDRKDSLFKTFSTGMKQRLALASVLLADPEVLVLDEPTNGLDPQGIAEVREMIKELGKEGKTILLASHILDEVEKVCTHVGVLKRGKLLASGNVDEILADEDVFVLAAENLSDLRKVLEQYEAISKITDEGDFLIVSGASLDGKDINAFAHLHGVVINHIARRKKTLEAQFLEITADQ